MKIIRIGYPGSARVKKMSDYLLDKYLPGFDYQYLFYEGKIEGWSEYIVNYLRSINDLIVVFALDDYLLERKYNDNYFTTAVNGIAEGWANIKLCECTKEEQEEYPVTTQFTIWNKEQLIFILKQTTTPWDFEIKGSLIARSNGLKTHCVPCIYYDVHSAISSRWPDINFGKLNQDDINEIQKL